MSACHPVRLRPLVALVPVAVFLAVYGPEATAGVFFDATLELGLRDDARVFLNVTNDYYAPPPAVAVDLVRRCPAPENDFPVILLLARASKRPVNEILKLRLDYLSWSDIMVRLNVSPSVLFVGMDRDPGPPYGKAWGYWKKHPRGERFEIRDRDVVELAKLQVATRYHHVSPYSVSAERNKGVTIEQYVYQKNKGKYKHQDHDNKAKGHGHQHDHP